ncbi:hypothetical protein EDD17DRAFT_1591142 [Pisolithus thermaeus]|nr:hypothetical protein EDD17DRAFT_1591142 [Pisolithus thermaeus]
MDFVRRFILELPTLFLIMHSTDDLAVVLVRLTERWDWIIAAYRSYLGLPAGNDYTIVCTLVLLTITQGMRLLYSQLTAEQLQILLDMVGPRTFTVVTAVPSFGVIVIPIMQILWITRSPITALSLMLLITIPVVILPLAMLCFVRARTRRSDDGQV